ncbi:DinB family protein [Oceanobacillus massiliensis]|uniref:DinB family protein n=1 Tax=Oceanobacillus massiliensis TaxID=1465765 RepID=UPI0003017685|nr:DinB family protein [Oceanobacillus massiliensis]
MQKLFEYNWIVRREWYEWCKEVEEDDLLLRRTGGVGGILHTLFHIVDVEWSWIQLMEGKPDFQENFASYNTLEKIKELDGRFHGQVEDFVHNWKEDMENNIVHSVLANGDSEKHTWGEIMRHIIAHEIHHIGQLSVWSRELGRKPISANLIGRGLG